MRNNYKPIKPMKEPAGAGLGDKGLRPHRQGNYGIIKQKRRTIMVRRKYYA